MSRNPAALVPVLAAVLVLLAPALCAAPRSDFDRVDFGVTIKDLAAAAAGERPLTQGRIFLLDGTVTTVTIVDKEEGSFRVRVELMSGEWIGREEVKSYTCLVSFSGPEWFTVFPARPPRTVPPGVVAPNARVLVAARPLGIVTEPDGKKAVSLEGLALRILQ
jgi:hypothetical protein